LQMKMDLARLLALSRGLGLFTFIYEEMMPGTCSILNKLVEEIPDCFLHTSVLQTQPVGSVAAYPRADSGFFLVRCNGRELM